MARSPSSASARVPPAGAAKFRCAIYTRKSSEEGLEQDFNSLDAQREACEAYILSQRHEGWIALPAMYDDGGISGGTMERPALKRLLADVAAGKIDAVVVYKVDRLTRSLADFAKIVEIFDQRQVSFVSVTQAFNTTSSMGRLTLNVLLSFAQFEREVTGERIRDKIAASKKKGMWMGGLPPLGYDVQDRKLVVNQAEAATVTFIFERYQALKSVRLLQAELDRRGIVSKLRKRDNGPSRGGQPIGRGALYAMLSNRLYRGEIVHKDVSHPGQHDAIIEAPLFNEVQQILAANRVDRERGTNADEPSLLAGLLFDADGLRMTPTHASKKGVRYRYYVSKMFITPRLAISRRQDADPSGATNATTKTQGGLRLPAAGIERLVIDRLGAFLASPDAALAIAAPDDTPTGHPHDAVEHHRMLQAVLSLASSLVTADPAAKRGMLLAAIHRVQVHRDRVEIRIDRGGLRQQLRSGDTEGQLAADSGDDPFGVGDTSGAFTATRRTGQPEPGDVLTLTVPVAFKRAGFELRLIVSGKAPSARPDASLVRLLARAHRIRDKLFADPEHNITSMAAQEGLTPSYLTRLLRLAFLAPDITTAILDGHQPVELTANKLIADTRLPIDWAEQRSRLGFE
ncbi:MAG: recombinase family protein [Rhizobiales bacterium]|nr:recombinase family protein [Hyphomicrobiales bacterium]